MKKSMILIAVMITMMAEVVMAGDGSYRSHYGRYWGKRLEAVRQIGASEDFVVKELPNGNLVILTDGKLITICRNGNVKVEPVTEEVQVGFFEDGRVVTVNRKGEIVADNWNKRFATKLLDWVACAAILGICVVAQ